MEVHGLYVCGRFVGFDILQGSFVFQAVLSWERMYVYGLCHKWLLRICTMRVESKKARREESHLFTNKK